MSPSSTSLSTRFGTVAVPNILLFQGAKPMARFNHTDRTLDTLTSFLVNQTGTNAGYLLHYIELTGLGSKGSELGGWKIILSHVKWIWTTTQKIQLCVFQVLKPALIEMWQTQTASVPSLTFPWRASTGCWSSPSSSSQASLCTPSCGPTAYAGSYPDKSTSIKTETSQTVRQEWCKELFAKQFSLLKWLMCSCFKCLSEIKHLSSCGLE